MSTTMDLIKSGHGLPPLMGNDVPMPPVKQQKRKMNFDKYYKLNESDVKEILAEYFNVNINNVSINITSVTVGCGMMEHEKNCIEVVVKEDKI